MSDTQCKILLDTNVWVDNYCPGHAGFESAHKLITVACRQNALLLYAFHSIKDVQFVVSREIRRRIIEEQGSIDERTALAVREMSWGCIKNMVELATAVGGDVADVWLSMKYLQMHPDLEDNLVISACRRAEADYLVTNDRQLILDADVVAKTPEQMIALLELKR